MYNRGVIEDVGDYGQAVISPIGNRSRMDSWIRNARVPNGMNVNELVGLDCIYSNIGGRYYLLGVYMPDDQIPYEYIETFGKEKINWAGDYRAILTKSDGSLSIS